MRTIATAITVVALTLTACAPAAAPTPTSAGSPTTAAAKPAASPSAAPSPAAAAAASPAALPIVDKSPVPAGEVGSAERPVVLVNVPFMDSNRLTKGMENIGRRLEEETGLKLSTSVPTSYVAVVEALCANRADAAFIPPLAYVLAHQQCGAEMRLVSVARGSVSYRGQVIARTDSPVQKLEDLKGKRFAWTDPTSASGYLYPRATVIQAGINPDRDLAQQVFAGGHDKVVIAVAQGQVDAGATYEGAESASGVLQTVPEAATKVRVVAKTADIPNDGVAIRKGLPPAIEQRIRDGLLRIAAGPEGDKLFFDAMGTNGLAPTDDSKYEPVRRAAAALGLNLEEEIRKQG